MLAKKFAVGFGIAIVFPVMIHYGVSTFVPEPKWVFNEELDYFQGTQDLKPEEKVKKEEQRKEARQKRKEQEKRFQKALFIVALPFGVAAILIGSIVAIQSVGTGLMFGGIFSLMDGYFNYWSELADWMRFASMIIAFVILVFVGYRKLAK